MVGKRRATAYAGCTPGARGKQGANVAPEAVLEQAPWTVRSADWPVNSKMTLLLIAKDIGKSSSCSESFAMAELRFRRDGGGGINMPA